MTEVAWPAEAGACGDFGAWRLGGCSSLVSRVEDIEPVSGHRQTYLVVGTVLANIIFLILCPNFVVPPRLSEQMGNALLALGLSLIPFAWGSYLLVVYRNAKERMLAYLAIGVSLLWLGASTYALVQVIRERKIDRTYYHQ